MEDWYEDIDKVVTLCGSRKFYKEIRATEAVLSKEGYVVFPPTFYNFKEETSREEIETIHRVHNTKMLMSSKIIVICPNKYIGEDTKREIKFAREHNIDVEFFDEVELYSRGIDNYNPLETYQSKDIIYDIERRVSNGTVFADIRFDTKR